MRQTLYALAPFLSIFVLHQLVVNVYTVVCAPFSIMGILRSLAMTGSPVCNALLHLINYTQNTYGILVTGFATWLIGSLTKQCKCEKSEI